MSKVIYNIFKYYSIVKHDWASLEPISFIRYVENITGPMMHKHTPLKLHGLLYVQTKDHNYIVHYHSGGVAYGYQSNGSLNHIDIIPAINNCVKFEEYLSEYQKGILRSLLVGDKDGTRAASKPYH